MTSMGWRQQQQHSARLRVTDSNRLHSNACTAATSNALASSALAATRRTSVTAANMHARRRARHCICTQPSADCHLCQNQGGNHLWCCCLRSPVGRVWCAPCHSPSMLQSRCLLAQAHSWCQGLQQTMEQRMQLNQHEKASRLTLKRMSRHTDVRACIKHSSKHRKLQTYCQQPQLHPWSPFCSLSTIKYACLCST